MAAVKNLIHRYAHHLLAKRIVAGDIVNTYIQEYLNGEVTRLNKQNRLGPMVETLKIMDTAMMDIGQLIIAIEGHSETLFYTTREQVRTRENLTLHAKEWPPSWKAGHMWKGKR